MKIVVACDSFKGTLSAATACAAIARGVHRALGDCRTVEVPLADGGEGTVAVLCRAVQAEFHRVTVTGPLGAPVEATYAVTDQGRVAIIEMAAAAGLTLVPVAKRDPARATTFGVGQLIADASDRGVSRILLGAGGSATCDAGCGAAQALGVRFIDHDGRVIEPPLAGGGLDRIASIDRSRCALGTGNVRTTVLCDVCNPLVGPRGAARVFAPQKGASAAQVARLDAGLSHVGRLMTQRAGVDVLSMPLAGAAGGLAGGLWALVGAELVTGAPYVIDAVGLADQCAGAAAIITGEGRFDAQSLDGKVVSAVTELGTRLHVPVYVLAGSCDLRPSEWGGRVKAVASVDAVVNADSDPRESLTQAAEVIARDWFAHPGPSG